MLRPRQSPSDLEWMSSIFGDRTDPIVRSKLMESSLSTGFPLQQRTALSWVVTSSARVLDVSAKTAILRCSHYIIIYIYYHYDIVYYI